MSAHGNAGEVNQARARKVRTGVSTVHIGKYVRSDEVADPHAGRPSVLHLLRARNTSERVLDRTPYAAELVIAENTKNPTRADLPVVATTNGAEPAAAAHALIDGQRRAGEGVPDVGVRSQEAAPPADKEIEAGPTHNRSRERSLHGHP